MERVVVNKFGFSDGVLWLGLVTATCCMIMTRVRGARIVALAMPLVPPAKMSTRELVVPPLLLLLLLLLLVLLLALLALLVLLLPMRVRAGVKIYVLAGM